MATKSTISIVKEDGTVLSSTCDTNSDILYSGAILLLYYQDKKKVQELIELGNMVLLHKEIYPIGSHSYDYPEDGVTIFRGRDNNKKNEGPKQYSSFVEFMTTSDSLQDFNYIFKEKNKKWYFANSLHLRLHDTSEEVKDSDIGLDVLYTLVKKEARFLAFSLSREFNYQEEFLKKKKEHDSLKKSLNKNKPLIVETSSRPKVKI